MLLSSCIRPNAAALGFSLRQREKRDSEALLHMFSQPRCRQGMVLDPFSCPEEFEAWLQNNGSKNFEPVATLEDKAVGLAGLFPCGGNQSHSAWVILFVHDAFQGRGVGTLMMTALVATAHMLDLRRLQLTVFCDNERAISLYRRFGFDIEGRHECYALRGDEFAAAFTMSRITKAAAAWPLSPVAIPAMAPAANPEPVAAPAMAPAAAAAAPAGTPALPPHVHLNSLGQATPDAGCSWVSNAPNDFRVQCNWSALGAADKRLDSLRRDGTDIQFKMAG
jgi:putative acetyltransferase